MTITYRPGIPVFLTKYTLLKWVHVGSTGQSKVDTWNDKERCLGKQDARWPPIFTVYTTVFEVPTYLLYTGFLNTIPQGIRCW